MMNNVSLLQVDGGLAGELERASRSVARATAYVHAIRRCAFSKKLDKNAKALFLLLVGQEEWTGRPCTKKLETLCEELDMSQSTLQRAIKALKEAKYINFDANAPHEPWTISIVPCNRNFVSYTALEFEQLAYAGLGVFEETRGVTGDTPKRKKGRGVTRDHKGINSLLLNTNVLSNKADGQEQPVAQIPLEGFSPAPDAPTKKGKRPQPTEELKASLASEELLFQMVNANRKARGMNKRSEYFDTLEQKAEYASLAQPYGSLEALKPALTRAFARGVYTVKDLLPVLRAQANPPKRSNGHSQHPAPPPRKVATAEEARAHLEQMRRERAGAVG